MEGAYSTARVQAFAHKKLLRKVAEKDSQNQEMYVNWKKEMKKLDSELASAKRKERKNGLNLSDDEASDDESSEEEEEEEEEDEKPKAKTVQFENAYQTKDKEEERRGVSVTGRYIGDLR
jgi:hypothetical protein